MGYCPSFPEAQLRPKELKVMKYPPCCAPTATKARVLDNFLAFRAYTAEIPLWVSATTSARTCWGGKCVLLHKGLCTRHAVAKLRSRNLRITALAVWTMYIIAVYAFAQRLSPFLGGDMS